MNARPGTHRPPQTQTTPKKTTQSLSQKREAASAYTTESSPLQGRGRELLRAPADFAPTVTTTHTHPTESGETKRSDRKQSALLSRQTHRDASGDREHARPQQSTTRSESVDSNLQRAPKQNTRPPAHPSRTPRHNCAVLLALRNRRISAAVLLHHHMSKPSSHAAGGEGSRSRVGREGRSSRGALLSRELVALVRSDHSQMLRKLGCDDGFM